MIGIHISITILPRNDIYSDYNLYHKVNAIKLMVDRLGLFTSMRLDIKRILFGFNSDNSFIDVTYEEQDNEEKIDKTRYNMLDIDWETLIANETDDQIKQMHEYFSSITPTNKNEYTGLFKGKNLIWFIAEAFDPIAIDKDITPTLYRLAQEGFNFTNFYTPLFLSTIDGEFMTQTGLIPRGDGKKSMNYIHDNYMPFTLANL